MTIPSFEEIRTVMDAIQFYRPVSEKLCQGDILERVPLLHLKDLPATISKATLSGKKQGFEQGPSLPDAPKPAAGSSQLVPAFCDYTRGILLTHDCQIDKPGTKHLAAALIRPLGPFPADQQEMIRGNQVHAYYNLPAGPAGIEEGYVDFRRITTLSVEIIAGATRLAGLTNTAWDGMMFQLTRFFTGIVLEQGRFVRPS